MKSFAEYRELEEAMGVDPISHKTYVKGGVPHSSRSIERHKFAITATVKGRGGKEEKIEKKATLVALKMKRKLNSAITSPTVLGIKSAQ